MNKSDEYMNKVSILFELCQNHSPHKWDELLKVNGNGNFRMREEVKQLLHNHKKAGAYFNILRKRIENEISLSNKPPGFKKGDRIDRFIIKRIINQGGMSEIYLAKKAGGRSEQLAAIKIMKPSFRNDTYAERFRNEQRILSSINHPNIATLFDHGITDNGYPFLIMEYIDGIPADRFCEQNKLNLNYRLKLFMKVCQAIKYAHNNQIIHQDIKPANILVTDDLNVKVIDFGISEIIQEGVNQPGKKSNFSGTICYASPEQLNGKQLSPASDIYQLGLLLYKMITGKLPQLCLYEDYEANSSKVLSDLSRLLKSRYSKMLPIMAGADLCAIFNRSIVPDIRKRYNTVYSLEADLKHLLNYI